MIAEFEARVLALIDDMVDHASDDELFAGGYLRGHLTLAVAEAEEQGAVDTMATGFKASNYSLTQTLLDYVASDRFALRQEDAAP